MWGKNHEIDWTVPGIDPLDEAFKLHALDYWKAETGNHDAATQERLKSESDQRLLAAMEAIPDQDLDEFGRRYRDRAIMFYRKKVEEYRRKLTEKTNKAGEAIDDTEHSVMHDVRRVQENAARYPGTPSPLDTPPTGYGGGLASRQFFRSSLLAAPHWAKGGVFDHGRARTFAHGGVVEPPARFGHGDLWNPPSFAPQPSAPIIDGTPDSGMVVRDPATQKPRAIIDIIDQREADAPDLIINAYQYPSGTLVIDIIIR